MNRDELLTKLAMELEGWPSAGKLRQHLEVDDPYFSQAKFVGEKFFPGPLEEVGDYGVIYRGDYLQRRTELINRPSWDDAPEWAWWLAQDADGEWGWYSVMPTRDDIGFESSCDAHEASSTGAIPAGHNWRDTLEPRPQAQATPQTCRHCDTTFNRPHVEGVPDDRCTRCDDEIKALWADHRPTKTWWTSKPCTQCGHTTAAKVSDDKPVCPGCVALSYDEVGDAETTLSQSVRDLADKHPEPITAESILRAGVGHMRDRASTYDNPQGERSMAATVDAFKVTTGIELTEEQGWHFMALLKLVRSQQGALRMDSYEDGAAYMALAGEAAAKDRG